MENSLTRLIEFFDSRIESLNAFKVLIMILAAVAFGGLALFLGASEGPAGLAAFLGLFIIFIVLE